MSTVVHVRNNVRPEIVSHAGNHCDCLAAALADSAPLLMWHYRCSFSKTPHIKKVELTSEQEEMSAVSNARGFVLNCSGDEAARNVVTRVLTQAGCRVREATNGHEARALAAPGPALAVLDVNMRGMNGLDGFDLHLVTPLQPENLYRILAGPSVGARRQQA
jgi:hypothetical protein